MAVPDPRQQILPLGNGARSLQKVLPDVDWVAFDVETTGLYPEQNRIIELGLVAFRGTMEIASHVWLFDPGVALDPRITEITGITPQDLLGQPRFADVVEEILPLLTDVDALIAYNARFDRGFLQAELKRCAKRMPETPWIDPYLFVRDAVGDAPARLSDAAARFSVRHDKAHRAVDDARAAALVLFQVLALDKDSTLAPIFDKQGELLQKRAEASRARMEAQTPSAPTTLKLFS